MILLKIFGSALGLIQFTLILSLFARYIYMEKEFSSPKKQQLFWGITIFASFFCGIMESVFNISEDFLVLAVFLLFALYIFLTRESNGSGGSSFCSPYLDLFFPSFYFSCWFPFSQGIIIWKQNMPGIL